MNAARILLAVPAGLCAAAVVLTIYRPPRRLASRVTPYTVAARTRMGDTSAEIEALLPPETGSPVVRVLGPMLRAAEDRLSRWLGHRDEAATALALEHAGITDVTPRQFRDQQFVFALAGVGLGIASGLLLGIRTGILLALVGLPWGFLRKRLELKTRTKARQERMRNELWQVNALLAIKAHATGNVQSVLAEFCAEAHGEIAGELRRILLTMEAGTPGDVALRLAASRTAEPFAGRLNRTLADAIEKGGDVAGALLNQAEDVRNAYRDDRLKKSHGRTTAMVAPATLMAGNVVLLIGAPILSLLFNVKH